MKQFEKLTTHIKLEKRGHKWTSLGVKESLVTTGLWSGLSHTFRYCQSIFFSTSEVSDHIKPEPFKSMLVRLHLVIEKIGHFEISNSFHQWMG